MTAKRSSPRVDGETLEQVTRELVAMVKQFYGRGPTKARTDWVGNDALVCLMGGGFTPAEQTLYESGREQAVHDMRGAFQDAMEDRVRALVERVTGRTVVAFMNMTNQNPDLSVQMFVLKPLPDDLESPVRVQDEAISHGDREPE